MISSTKKLRSTAFIKCCILLSFFILSFCDLAQASANIGQAPSSQTYYDYDETIRSIYQDIIELRLDKASASIEKYGTTSNLTLLHMKSYVDFFSLFINENLDNYNRIVSKRDQYLDILESGDSSSPYHKFIQAEILLQWALIDIKFDKKLRAGRAIYKAYNLLEENKKLFPTFISNNKSLSIIHVLSESLPSWVRTLLGIDGSIAKGKREITEIKLHALKNADYFFRQEVAAINSYILYYQANEKKQAIVDLGLFDLDHTTSPLIAFLKASMALKDGKNSYCLKVLEECPRTKDQRPFYYLDFMKGRCKLYAMRNDADLNLLKFVDQFKGQHFIKEAYQKLAWHAIVVKDDPSLYQSYMKKCQSKGNSLVDEDKQALAEANSAKMPNPILLKARLLYDGGYYHQVYNHLAIYSEEFINGSDDDLEYHYRLGRSFQSLSKDESALIEFAKVLDLAKLNKHYSVASSALQMGSIHETRKDKEKALYYYKYCLDQDSELYKTSIHQKAKSGIERVNSWNINSRS